MHFRTAGTAWKEVSTISLHLDSVNCTMECRDQGDVTNKNHRDIAQTIDDTNAELGNGQHGRKGGLEQQQTELD
jgi:hypothetical protein